MTDASRHLARHGRVGAALIAAGAWFGPGLAVHWPPIAAALDIPLSLPDGSSVVLTFDDGPHPEGTPAVLEALEHAGAPATFFLVGEQVLRYSELVREIVAAGHEPAVHGYRHCSQMRLLPAAFVADLERAVAVIGEASGRAPALYRPPYGVFTIPGLSAVRRSSLEPLLWSKWGRDWRARTTPAEIAALATRGLGAGDVVLLHDADWYSETGSHRHTARALPAILDEIGRRELRPVRAGDLIERG